MNCRTFVDSQIGIIAIDGEIDRGRDILLLQDTARELLEDKRLLALDLRSASYVRASICGLLITLLKETRKHGVVLALVVNPGQPIHTILRIAGIDRWIRVFPSGKLLCAWAAPEEPELSVAAAVA